MNVRSLSLCYGEGADGYFRFNIHVPRSCPRYTRVLILFLVSRSFHDSFASPVSSSSRTRAPTFHTPPFARVAHRSSASLTLCLPRFTPHSTPSPSTRPRLLCIRSRSPPPALPLPLPSPPPALRSPGSMASTALYFYCMQTLSANALGPHCIQGMVGGINVSPANMSSYRDRAMRLNGLPDVSPFFLYVPGFLFAHTIYSLHARVCYSSLRLSFLVLGAARGFMAGRFRLPCMLIIPLSSSIYSP